MKLLSFRHNYAFVCQKCFKHFSSTVKPLPKDDLTAPAYQPQKVENKYSEWEKRGIFQAKDEAKDDFSMVLPPPNVTGKLHLGHALTCTVQDVIARRMRAKGHNVLWLPGTDHAGIATQTIVEKYLKITKNLHRKNLGREKFSQEVWKWKELHSNTISQQLKSLGCSLDWTKEVFTMSPRHTEAVNIAFIRLFEKGLIYRKKALVNWCNALKSTISDIEVENVEIEKPVELRIPGHKSLVKFGQLYKFAYKIVDSNEEIVVATTMPETMLGDVAIAVHPNDERYKHLLNKRVYHPFRDTTIPIIFDEFVDPKFGTGAVKITPAHSKIDYEVAKIHYLELVQVFGEDGIVDELLLNTDIFKKLKRYECREVIVEKLNELGLLKEVVPHKMTLPKCSRTGDVIEHIPKEQWFLSCTELNKKALEVVENGELKIEPEKFVKNWLDWTKEDKDWCISRQLWWGHQIPAYKCSVDGNSAWIAASNSNEAKIKASKVLKQPEDVINVERDTDVLDTWFSSGIYPFAAMGWPDEESKSYQKYYPLSLMVTGHDILGFWVHRMVILGLELTGKLPFNNVLLHGVICDNKGAKMSKSKGNVIDPIDIIKGICLNDLKAKSTEMHNNGILSKDELKKALAYHKSNFSNTNGIPECGVDALRFTLLSQDIKSHFVNFDVNYCHANKLFCNKIWQSIKYLQLCHTKLRNDVSEITVDNLTFFDKWILSKLASMIEVVNETMDDHDFHLATRALRTFIYNQMCDVYLEATKSGFKDNVDSSIGYAHVHTLAAVLNTSLRCLNPFMINLTEELIPKIPDFENNIICNYKDSDKDNFDFPQYNDFEAWKDDKIEAQVDKFFETLTLVRELKGQYGVSNKLRPSVNIKSTDEHLKSAIKDNTDLVLYMTKCGNIKFDEETGPNFVKGFLDHSTEVSVEVIADDVANSILEARLKLKKKIAQIEEALSKLETTMASEEYRKNTSESKKLNDEEKLGLKRQELKQLQKLIE